MKMMQMFKLAMIVLFLFGVVVGCAKKPVATPMDDQAKVGQSDMAQQAEVKGVAAQPVQGEVVPSHDAVAGLERIYFDFDQFTLTDAARATLAQNAKYLMANSNLQVVVEGHCDERGSDEYNLALGESRALAAKAYLESLGVSAKRLSVISYGEEKALVAGSGEDAWSKNRRAEFKAVH